MTIAKVELSKAELDHSLFEYEQQKTIKKCLNDQQYNSNENKKKVASHQEKNRDLFMPKFTEIDEIEKEFIQFCLDNKGLSEVKLNEIQIGL